MIFNESILNNFTTIFLSIILEAMPFIMLGAFISSMIQIFISEEAIAKLIPKNKFIGILCGSLIGIIFPVCECAIVPITRRLIKKGVPLHIGITFMLATPIINPVVLLSTYHAFAAYPTMVYLRGGLGLLSAMLIGYLVSIGEEKAPLKQEKEHIHTTSSPCACGHHHGSVHPHKHKTIVKESKLNEILNHTSAELYDIGKYLIMGAFLAAIFQTFIPRSLITSIGQGTLSSILIMLLFAYVLSLCSEADAFIAATFMGQFTTGSILGFLILGPMIDIKNTLMLLEAFKSKFVCKLIILIFSICAYMAMMVYLLGW